MTGRVAAVAITFYDDNGNEIISKRSTLGSGSPPEKLCLAEDRLRERLIEAELAATGITWRERDIAPWKFNAPPA